MNVLALFALFECLCYGSTATINVSNLHLFDHKLTVHDWEIRTIMAIDLQHGIVTCI